MILMDEKGNKIEAIVKYDLDKRKKELKEDNTYILQNFDVQINDGHYRKCDHQFRLMFMKGTSEHDLVEIPLDSYAFKNFGDILSGNLNSDFLIDVIGVFYRLIDYQPNQKSGNILNTTPWEEYTSKFESFHGSHKAGPMVIILTLAKIKEPEENYTISIQNSKQGSKLLINMDIVEIQHFRNRYRLEVKVCHKNHHAKFVMWDHECFQLIGQKAVDLLELVIAKGELNPAAFPVAIDDILGLTLAFKIKV